MEHVIYTKFSNDRADCFKIKTSIYVDENKKRQICKQALSSSAKAHIDNMHSIGLKLKEQFSDTKFDINESFLQDDRIIFEYLDYPTLSELLDELLAKNDLQNFEKLVLQYFDLLRSSATEKFAPTDAYKAVFGNLAPNDDAFAAPISNVDMIFENIFVADDKWIITDYEWTFDFPIPIDFIIYRTVFYFELGQHATSLIGKIDLYKLAGITDEQKELYKKMDDAFQRYVVGDTILLGDIHAKIKGEIFFPHGMVEQQRVAGLTRNITVCQHCKDAPDDIIYRFSPTPDIDGHVRFEIKPEVGVERIHINPADCHCVVHVFKIQAVGEENSDLDFVSNGVAVGKNHIIFENENPSFLVAAPNDNCEKIEVDLFIEYSTETFVKEQALATRNYAQQINTLSAENEQLKQQLAQIQQSASWKITKPLRSLGRGSKDK